ncbi:MAG TPA: nucleoside hydrolase [Terriglobales bacterium]|nr:nucleoside hydrolase [Terriglobales bacterium]
MSKPGTCPRIFCLLFLLSLSSFCPAQTPQSAATSSPQKIIIDTDIGDDIDDAFAVALALRSPEVQILGISTTFGDVETRAKLLDRLLGEAGHEDIPVTVGVHDPKIQTNFSQRAYAEGWHFAPKSHPQAVDFILDQIRKNPGEITLVTIGALGNVGAMIDKDPQTFRQLKRVVMMGGSIYRGYGDLGYTKPHGPDAEWNVKLDVLSMRKLLASGVPVFIMPLDSTQLKLDEVKRAIVFKAATPLTDQLTLLYNEWEQETPTLFDAMTIAFIDKPDLCPVTPMHIVVDDKGFTRPTAGVPNAQVCLDSDPELFFRFYIPRVIEK